VLNLALDLSDSSKHSSLERTLTRAILRRVATAFGLVGLAAFIACVIALAAGITWLVVRLSPAPGSKKPKPEATPET